MGACVRDVAIGAREYFNGVNFEHRQRYRVRLAQVQARKKEFPKVACLYYVSSSRL